MLFLAKRLTDLEENYQSDIDCLVSKPEVIQLCDRTCYYLHSRASFLDGGKW